jgi:Co/Zn/Cd efflux system component
MRYKDGDANVRSVWLCSRNDAIGNLGVVVAAGLVYCTNSGIPDLVMAGAMAGLFCWSASEIIRRALAELKQEKIGMASV